MAQSTIRLLHKCEDLGWISKAHVKQLDSVVVCNPRTGKDPWGWLLS